MGKHYSVAIAELGPPTSRSEDGQGGQVLQWSFLKYNVFNGSQYIATRTVWVNADGIIYRYSWRGL
ncbi:MAG: hypothetical protein GTN64_07490 [Candidatus Latescibacteria bacterium]|nr:hypothetical protein [Candidatus Latescibacterota bacterium]NIO78446.1 hypothetical protein [Candidatus Latescibacterota bacterium]